jgi:hypothetical protein
MGKGNAGQFSDEWIRNPGEMAREYFDRYVLRMAEGGGFGPSAPGVKPPPFGRSSKVCAGISRTSTIPAWAAESVKRAVEGLPMMLGVVVQRPGRKRWQVVLYDEEEYRWAVGIELRDQREERVELVVRRALAKAGFVEARRRMTIETRRSLQLISGR